MARRFAIRCVWVALALVACATSPPPAPAAPHAVVVTQDLPAQGRFAPLGPAAATYANLVALVPRDALDTRVLATLQERSVAQRPMQLDVALSRACAELAATELDDRGWSDGLVDTALHRHGVIDPSPRIYVVWGDPREPDTIAALLRAKLAERDFYAPALRVGIGVGPPRDGVTPIVVAMVGTRIAIAPIARTARAGAVFAIDATLDARLAEPQVVVHREDGTVERRSLTPGTTVTCSEVPSRIDIEITATHAQGPVTVASFPVWCAMTPSSEYRWEHAAIADGLDTPDALERRVLALVDRDRRATGAPPLVVDREVTAAARAHARDGKLPAVPGSAFSAVESRDLRSAYEALANAVAGREHLLAATSTHVGVGVARKADGRLAITVIYRRVPPAIDRAAAAREVTARIEAWTKVEAYPPLVAIAQRLADELVAGTRPFDAWQDMRWWLQDLRWRFAYFRYGIAFVPKLALTTRDALLGPGTIHAFGVAVRQADHPRFGPNTIWIVVVYGERK